MPDNGLRTSVQETTGHVFSVSWVAFYHLVGWFEASIGDFSDWQLFMVSLFGWDNWGISYQWEMDTGIWHQVSLEFSKINIESTIESERGSNWGNNLANESVKVGVCWSFNIQVSAANVIDSFIVYHESAVRVFKCCMSSQDSIIRLNDSSSYLWGWVDGEFKLWFLSVINRQTFHEEGGESRSGTTTERVEEKKTLKSWALVGQLTYTV